MQKCAFLWRNVSLRTLPVTRQRGGGQTSTAVSRTKKKKTKKTCKLRVLLNYSQFILGRGRGLVSPNLRLRVQNNRAGIEMWLWEYFVKGQFRFKRVRIKREVPVHAICMQSPQLDFPILNLHQSGLTLLWRAELLQPFFFPLKSSLSEHHEPFTREEERHGIRYIGPFLKHFSPSTHIEGWLLSRFLSFDTKMNKKR